MGFHPEPRGFRPFARLGACLCAGAVGLTAFLTRFGIGALDPTNINWLMSGDWGQHLLGWLMFRRAEWTFPLGATPNLAFPVESTIAYSDSLPLLALPAKVFESVLPEPFQFIGLWLATCFALQGVFAALWLGTVVKSPLVQALGGSLIALSPALAARVGHDTLCAHFLLLAMFWLYFRQEAGRATRGAGLWARGREQFAGLVVVALSTAVHPFICVMVLALAMALVVRGALARQLSRPEGAAFALANLAVAVGGFAVLGYIGRGTSRSAPGFGGYGADLLTFVNPMGWSRLMPDLPSQPGAYEGMGFLGLGAIALGALALVFAVRERRRWRELPWRTYAPLLVTCGLLALFAASSTIRIAGKPLIGLRGIDEPFLPFVEQFRSSGRFVWPLHYLAMFGAIAGALALLKSRPRLALVTVAIALVIQVADRPPNGIETNSTDAWLKLRSPRWSELAEGKRDLVLYPPHLNGGGTMACDAERELPEDLYLSAGWLALTHGMRTNSGYLARIDFDRAERYCAGLTQQLVQGGWQRDTLYVLGDPSKQRLVRDERVHCERLDGLWACVASR